MNAAIQRLRPLHDSVVIKRARTPEKIGRIFVPETARKESAHEGTIVAMGNGRTDLGAKYRMPAELKVGQRVFFDPTYRDDTHIDGNDYVRLRARFILAIIDE